MGWGWPLGGSEGGAIPVLLPVGKGGGGVVYVDLWAGVCGQRCKCDAWGRRRGGRAAGRQGGKWGVEAGTLACGSSR